MIDYKNNELPKVSMIMPCYNHEKFVKEAIQSVIDQDYKNIELIIIDDGSTDNSVKAIQEMIAKCEERFVRFEFRSRPNKGLCFTLNEALEWCKGDFLAGVASDDTIKTYKTSLQVKYLIKNPESIGVFGGIELVYEDTGVIEVQVAQARKYGFENILLHQHNLPASTSLLRIDPVRKLGGYKEAFLIEDWSLWLFLTEQGGTLDYMDVVLGTYRRHQSNLSLQLERMLKGRVEIANLFNDNILYNKALSQVYYISALEWQGISFIKSLKYTLVAVKLNYIGFYGFFKTYVKRLFRFNL